MREPDLNPGCMSPNTTLLSLCHVALLDQHLLSISVLGATLCISIVSISPFFPCNFYAFIYFLTYISLWWVFAAALRLSPVALSGGHSAAFRLLTVWLLTAEHRLQCAWASVVSNPRLQTTSSIVVTHCFCCSLACGIFLDQGSNLCLLHWRENSLPLSHQGSS